MVNPCPACGTKELPLSLTEIKNPVMCVVPLACSRCGYVFDKETNEAASGKKWPTYVEVPNRKRICTLDDVVEECPMNDGAPDCEYAEGNSLLFRCGFYRLEPIEHVDGGPLRVPEDENQSADELLQKEGKT